MRAVLFGTLSFYKALDSTLEPNGANNFVSAIKLRVIQCVCFRTAVDFPARNDRTPFVFHRRYNLSRNSTPKTLLILIRKLYDLDPSIFLDRKTWRTINDSRAVVQSSKNCRIHYSALATKRERSDAPSSIGFPRPNYVTYRVYRITLISRLKSLETRKYLIIE